MNKNIRIIIFDLDGTLVNAYKAVAQSLNFAFKKAGYPTIDDETIKRSVGWGDKNLLGRFIKKKDLAGALKNYRQHHKHSLKTGTKFLPGAKKLIIDLKRAGYKLAIASNRPTKFTLIILKHLKIHDQFDQVLCADKVKRGKPAPDLLWSILTKQKMAKQEALYVGDMAIDVEAGRRAHIRTVAVLTGSSLRKDIVAAKPFAIISRISEIKRIIKRKVR